MVARTSQCRSYGLGICVHRGRVPVGVRVREAQVALVVDPDEAFADVIVRLSALCVAAPEIAELDLNPLLGTNDYQPLVRGIKTALPYLDDFLPVHNLSSLEQLGNLLQRLGEHKPLRRQWMTPGQL